MNIGDILPIIIILVVLVSMIRKRLASGKSRAPKRSEGLREIFGNMIAQIGKEIERARREASGEATGWERFVPKDTEAGPVLEEKEAVEALPPSPKPAVMKEKIPALEKEAAVAKPARYRCRHPDYVLKNLRKAVVWSEILAPPLALRDE